MAISPDCKSRKLGKPTNIPNVKPYILLLESLQTMIFQTLCLNIFLKYYSDYETALRIFSDWIKLS